MKKEQLEAKCYNCKYSGQQFKIDKLTHLHCEHPNGEISGLSSPPSPWDTLREFWDSCESHEPKNINK